MMLHYRKHRKSYSRLQNADEVSGDCPFCRDTSMHGRIMRRTTTMFVIPNRTRYDLFEGLRVSDHLMVIPQRHVEMIDDFTQTEKLEMMDIIGEYEEQGYSVYARGVGSVNRSVKHQHTHLIKLRNTRPRFVFYTNWPYILVDR